MFRTEHSKNRKFSLEQCNFDTVEKYLNAKKEKSISDVNRKWYAKKMTEE